MSEPHEQLKNGYVLRFVKDYWFLIAFVVGAAMAWSSLQAEVKANAIVNEEQQGQIKSLTDSLNVLDRKYIEDISVIKTRLQQLK